MLTTVIAIFLPFIVALLLLLFAKNNSRFHIGWIVLIVPFTLFILLLQQSTSIAQGKSFQFVYEWIPSFNIYFATHIDGLGYLFSLLITGVGTLVLLYSIYYMTTDEALKQFYIYLLLFMGSMLGIVFSDHLIVLYVFWELTSISSFLLIAFWFQRRGSRDGAKKSLLITVFGGFAMLASFLMIYSVTGTFRIQDIISQVATLQKDALFIPIIILLLLGAFTKSVQFPFHIWLPDAMEAPTPVSAYLHSATMVKAGIYLVARFTPAFGGSMPWFWIVTMGGLLTLIWAAFIALRQTDLKALLAYSTVSQLGLIMSLFGVSSLSFHPKIDVSTVLITQASFAALFHLVNHATFKGALFMVIGIIDFQIGSRDLRRLGGLVSVLPLSFTIALIGSFSMAGLPPFNGFLSKEMFFAAMLHIKHFDLFSSSAITTLFPVIAFIASVFTFMYSITIVWQTFFGKGRSDEAKQAIEPSFGMLISPTILASLVIVIFIYPNVLANYVLKPAVISIYPSISMDEIQSISHWNGFNRELMMTIGIIVLGSILYYFRHYFSQIFRLFPEQLSFNQLYNMTLLQGDRLSKSLTNMYMTGYLRHYFSYIFIFITIVLGSVFIYSVDFMWDTSGDLRIDVFHWLLAGTIIVAAIAIPFIKYRLSAILINGFIGFAIAMFFVLFRAPDLALTQLVVETVTTALFLLAFYFLPEWDRKQIAFQWKNGLIAIVVGTLFTVIALAVNNERLFVSIASYFEESEELTGAKNIVNTILGDFRAFDTMLEVIVLFIAGLGVFSLIQYKRNKGVGSNEDQ